MGQAAALLDQAAAFVDQAVLLDQAAAFVDRVAFVVQAVDQAG
jgi:hypothetical protein